MNWDKLKQHRDDLLLRFPLLLLFRYEKWSLLAFGAFLSTLLGGVLFLPPIWTVSPDGFEPEVTISMLDWVQCRALQRTARRQMTQGELDEAAYSWQAATANNPADLAALRGGLNCLFLLDRPNPKYIRAAASQSFWLLRLARTNRADLELAVSVFDRFGMHHTLMSVLNSVDGDLSDLLLVKQMKALLHTGRGSEFARLRREHRGLLDQDPSGSLYDAAFVAGWESEPGMESGLDLLEHAVEDPGRQLLARRLLLLVWAMRNDLESYYQGLRELQDQYDDTFKDHLVYWKLLLRSGMRESARRHVKDYARPPAGSSEVIHLAELYQLLGELDRAIDLVRNYSFLHDYDPAIWVTWANLLYQAKRWAELFELALKIRLHNQVGPFLLGYSHYLEGLGFEFTGRHTSANRSFWEASEFHHKDPAMVLEMAKEMVALGKAGPAMSILLPWKEKLGDLDRYWHLLFAAAYGLKDTPTVVEAATRAFQLNPMSEINQNNYAAVLILTREQPEVALKLTLGLNLRFPHSPVTRLNHVLALLLSYRVADAEELLDEIRTEQLTPIEVNMYHYGWFQVHIQRQEYRDAVQSESNIDPQFLFPEQLAWMREARHQIPQTATDPGEREIIQVPN